MPETWPPDLPPATRTDATSQAGSHATDHNQIATALAAILEQLGETEAPARQAALEALTDLAGTAPTASKLAGRLSGTINVLTTGTVPGETNSAPGIQAAIDAAAALGADVYVPRRTADYKVTTALTVPAGTRILSDGATIDQGSLPFLIVFDSKNGLTLDGLNYKSDTSARAVVHALNGSANITIRRARCDQVRLFTSNNGLAYATASGDLPGKLVTNIRIDDVVGVAGTTIGPFIEGRYVDGYHVTNVSVTGYQHGVMWWGGDSNPITGQGVVANARLATNIRITDVRAYNVGLGGVWGSMGENIILESIIATGCGDVGIDVEGCNFVTITGCVTRNCANGGIACFFYNRGVTITGCTMSTTVDQWLFAVYNANLHTENRDITVAGCTFIGVGVIAKVGHDSGANVTLRACTFRNARLTWDVNNNGTTEVDTCSFVFDIVAGAALTAVQLYRARVRHQAIRNTSVVSLVTQPAGSMALRVDNDDFGGSRLVVVDNCQFMGFPIDVEFKLGSGNAGFTAAASMSNCVVDAGVVNRVEGTTYKSALRLENNYRNTNAGISPWPSALPTVGKWDAGQTIKNPAPAAGGSIGWIATTGGRLGDTAWAASTAYALNDIRLNGTRVYLVTTAGTSAASGGPTGTGTGIVDGTVTWKFIDNLAVFKTYGAVAA